MSRQEAKRRFEAEWPHVANLTEFCRMEIFTTEEVQSVATLKRNADAKGIPETDPSQPWIGEAFPTAVLDGNQMQRKHRVGTRIGVFF